MSNIVLIHAFVDNLKLIHCDCMQSTQIWCRSISGYDLKRLHSAATNYYAVIINAIGKQPSPM
jgi:hypothetical protein